MIKNPLQSLFVFLATFFMIQTGPYSWADSLKPKYGPQATPLSASHEYFQEQGLSSFWSWIPYYIPQRDGKSCSLASVTMLLNAARSQIKLTQEEPLVTQDDLLKKVNSPIWNQGLSQLGRGIQLDQLAELVRISLKTYGIPFHSVEVLHIKDSSEAMKKKVHEALQMTEKSNQVLMLANFLMKVYTDDAEVGHISPVGAYDSKRKRVLILDSDRRWYEPYWVSEETFLKGMATQDSESKQNRGYVFVKLTNGSL